MSSKFVIEGKHPLNGIVHVSGSKNAALPCIAATLLTKGVSTLYNVPDIADVHAMLGIIKYLGAKTTFKKNTVTIDTTHVKNKKVPHEMVHKLRASILLLGPLLSRFHEVEMDFPGGCVLGKRSIRAHINALEDLGAKILETKDTIHLKGTLSPNMVIMWEVSVTGTENALMAASRIDGTSIIRLSAQEPHVQNLCHMLSSMGADIQGIGTHTIKVTGTHNLSPCKHTIVGDYIEMGTFAVAGTTVPGSKITITGAPVHDLDSFWCKLREVGGKFTFIDDTSVKVEYVKNLEAFSKLETRLYPGFPTDLQAPFSVILTQSEGKTKIFETLFEGRFNYLYELEKMGARVELSNEHQAFVTGKDALRGKEVVSCDLRAGVTMVLAGLLAEGTTIVHDINYIDRGYEKVDKKLQKLGAHIKRLTE